MYQALKFQKSILVRLLERNKRENKNLSVRKPIYSRENNDPSEFSPIEIGLDNRKNLRRNVVTSHTRRDNTKNSKDFFDEMK